MSTCARCVNGIFHPYLHRPKRLGISKLCTMQCSLCWAGHEQVLSPRRGRLIGAAGDRRKALNAFLILTPTNSNQSNGKFAAVGVGKRVFKTKCILPSRRNSRWAHGVHGSGACAVRSVDDRRRPRSPRNESYQAARRSSRRASLWHPNFDGCFGIVSRVLSSWD